MKHAALRLIRDEHRSLATVLRAAEHVVGKALAQGTAPDFELLRAILYYLHEFPEKRHHVIEDRVLFARIKARTHDADAAIAQLEDEHRRGEWLLQVLANGLNDWEAGADGGASEFAELLADFARFYWAHMEKEENEVLPAAERALSTEDWHEIHASFELNADPMYGEDTANEFRDLFSRILRNAPVVDSQG